MVEQERSAEVGRVSVWLSSQDSGIQPSYVSRVSNSAVRELLGTRSLSDKLLEHQLLLLGRIAQADQDNVLRKAILERDSVVLVRPRGLRRRVRPRNHWVNEVHKIAEGIAGSKPNLANMLSQVSWERAVKEYCSNLPCG